MAEINRLYSVLSKPSHKTWERLLSQQGTNDERPLLPHLPELSPSEESAMMETAVSKGAQLLQLMHNPEHEPSRFQNPSDLKQHYRRVPKAWLGYDCDSFSAALAPLNINPEVSNFDGTEAPNHMISHEYRFESSPPGYQNECRAEFTQFVNPSDGLLVAYDNTSPTEVLREAQRPINHAPELKFWSDVAFLQWKMFTSPADDLKYVLRHNVQNTKTAYITRMVCRPHHVGFTPWPGVTFDASSEQGKALLGTPNGSGVAYMLIRHREHLGWKVVDKITAFHIETHNGRQPMLLFKFVKVEVDGSKVSAPSEHPTTI